MSGTSSMVMAVHVPVTPVGSTHKTMSNDHLPDSASCSNQSEVTSA